MLNVSLTGFVCPENPVHTNNRYAGYQVGYGWVGVQQIRCAVETPIRSSSVAGSADLPHARLTIHLRRSRKLTSNSICPV